MAPGLAGWGFESARTCPDNSAGRRSASASGGGAGARVIATETAPTRPLCSRGWRSRSVHECRSGLPLPHGIDVSNRFTLIAAMRQEDSQMRNYQIPSTLRD